jgi:lysozyme
MDQSLPSSNTFDLTRVARLVRPFETLETRAVPRPGGGWTIGYGHVRSARAGAEVTLEDAEALLLYDLRQVAERVRGAIYAPVHRNQLEALVAFAFHIGADRFLTSTALQRFNAGDSLGAAQELERWCCGDFGGEISVVDALVRRRAAEKAHFLTPPDGFPKASRTRLPPQVEGATATGPDETGTAPSAALAAAHTISARLRALVPDSPADTPLDLADPDHLRPATFEPTPAPHAPPSAAAAEAPAHTVAEPQPTEIPPPPMPFELEPHPVRPEPARSAPALDDVWPAFTPSDIGSHDPFAQGPLDAAAIEAPAPDALTLDRTESIFVGSGAKSRTRAERPPQRAQTAETPPSKASSSKLSASRLGTLGLWAALLLGVAVFVWSIWSIFETTPGPVNFIAGLLGIAMMAAPAYLLLGARGR